MIYPLMPQTEMQGAATFHCNNMKQEIEVARCMSWYVDHTALGRKTSPCHKCKQGCDVREAFARS